MKPVTRSPESVAVRKLDLMPRWCKVVLTTDFPMNQAAVHRSLFSAAGIGSSIMRGHRRGRGLEITEDGYGRLDSLRGGRAGPVRFF